MNQAFAFFSRGSRHAGDDADDAATATLPAWLVRSEAFVEDLDLMPAPQAVRRMAVSSPTADSAGRVHGFWLQPV